MSPDTIARAKNGDRAAINAVLRDATPALRYYVRVALRGVPTSYDVFDDALAAALEQAWRKIGEWDPARGALATFIRPGVHSATQRFAAHYGHAVALTSYHGADKSKFAPLRARGARRARSMEAPANADTEDPLVERLPGASVDVESLLDAKTILARLPKSADLLMRAQEDSLAEIGRQDGMSKEYAGRLYRRALDTARAVAGVKVAA